MRKCLGFKQLFPCSCFQSCTEHRQVTDRVSRISAQNSAIKERNRWHKKNKSKQWHQRQDPKMPLYRAETLREARSSWLGLNSSAALIPQREDWKVLVIREESISSPSPSIPAPTSCFTIDQQAKLGPKWEEQAHSITQQAHDQMTHRVPLPGHWSQHLFFWKLSLIFRAGTQLKPHPLWLSSFSGDILFLPLNAKLLPRCVTHSNCQHIVLLQPTVFTALGHLCIQQNF